MSGWSRKTAVVSSCELSSSLGFVLNFNSLFQLPPEPGPLEFGSAILAEGVDTADFVDHLAWGPTPATAGQLLFAGNVVFESEGIYLVTQGSDSAGEPLVAFDSTENILGLAWLPDGLGFVYSITEGEYFGEDRSANLFIYDIDSGKATRVTSLVGDFAGQVSVSSDGQQFVFERAAELTEFNAGLLDPDLWLVNRDGSGSRLFVEDAYAPAWSW